MSKTFRLLAVTLACPIVIHAVPVAAQDREITRPPTIPPPAPPAILIDAPGVPFPNAKPSEEHFALIVAMREGADENAALDAMLVDMENAWARDPDMAKVEAISPGALAEAARSTRPILQRHSKRIQDQYEPQMAALFARYLSPAEASEMAEFYRSEAGRRFVKSLSQNFSGEAALEDYETTTTISREQLDRDTATTVSNTFEQMSRAELDRLEQTFAAYPVLQKQRSFLEPMRVLRLQMENEPLLPQDEAEAMQSIMKVFERRLR